MSDEWDTVVKIGAKAGRGAGGPRETTIKNKSQLNAAMRSGGVVATEKKYGTANASSSSGSGQFLTKVDRSDDIVKPKTGDPNVKSFLNQMQTKLGMNRSQFAQEARIPADKLNDIFAGKPADQKVLDAIENKFGIYVRGAKQGQKKGKRATTYHDKLFPDSAGTDASTKKP